MSKKTQLTTARLRIYLADAEILNFYRRNPVIACEDLLGIYLSDAQAYALAGMWTADVSVFAASRNWGKSFIIAIICLLRAILYPDQNIYIVSSVGSQAKETHTKLEELCLRTGHTAASTPDLKDIAMGEIETSVKNPTGFKHDPSSYEVRFHNGSAIYTLNASPNNARGKRSNLTVFDEAAFCAEDLIVAVEPFSTQNSDARYGANTAVTKDILPRQPYNQILFCSSQDTVDALFYKRYKECAKRMLAGDTSRFCIDMTCETAITMYMKGKEIPPLLSRSTVEAALKNDASKAHREYYNKADLSGGDNQIIKWGTMRHNETQIIPYEECRGNKIILGFDPARTMDNSIITAMEIVDDPNMGICGNIVGCTNLVDIASKKKYKLDSNRQLEEIRNILLAYNGDNLDYEYIDSLQIDSGSGGGGISTYADQLLNDFVGPDGRPHKGLIDLQDDKYFGYRSRYPNAVDKVRLVSPRKYRTQMVEEFIELMELGVIRFPYTYNGADFLKIVKGVDEDGEEIMETYMLSQDEKIHLSQIDLMKTEICSIHKSTNAEGTNVTYALAKEKQNTMHDDRFYSILLCAHRLYEIRRGKQIKKSRPKRDISAYMQFRAPKIL